MALKLDILANTRQFISEMKKGGASVEDVSEELDDMAREGKQAGEKLERSFKDLAKTADTTGSKVGTGLDDGFRKAEGGVEDFRSEAAGTMRETAASISSVEDGLGAVQEIAANAFVGFGPVGAGAGLVAALGFGLLLENLNKQNEAIAAQKQYYADAYQSAAEEGRKYLDVQTILREANDIMFNADRVDEYNRAVKDAEALGLSINDILLARAGDEKSLQAILDVTKQKQEEAGEAVLQAGEDSATGIDLMASAEVGRLSRIEREYTGLVELHAENASKAASAQSILDQLSQQERDQIQRTKDASQARFDALAQSIAKVPASKTVDVKLRVDQHEVDNYWNTLQQRARTGITVNVRPGQGRLWE